MDGRAHSEGDYLNPSHFGHSVGRWGGDTLIIDAVGFNERFWIHREGYPRTEALQPIERITRPDIDTLRYEIAIDDSLACAADFLAVRILREQDSVLIVQRADHTLGIEIVFLA